jgi:hypothetical protein
VNIKVTLQVLVLTCCETIVKTDFEHRFQFTPGLFTGFGVISLCEYGTYYVHNLE